MDINQGSSRPPGLRWAWRVVVVAGIAFLVLTKEDWGGAVAFLVQADTEAELVAGLVSATSTSPVPAVTSGRFLRDSE